MKTKTPRSGNLILVGALNWLVVGNGDITSRRVIPAILAEPRSALYGVVTRDPAKAESYNCRAWTSLDEALRDPAVGAVYVGTPVFLHAPQSIAALRAGKPVLCEKPTALNYTEAVAIRRAAEETGRLCGVAYYRRRFPKLLRARDLLAQGVIGRPVVAYVTCHSWSQPSGGARDWLFRPETAGGGPLYDIASHRIDALNFLFGAPQRATGLLSNVVHQLPVEDAATVLIDYASGVRGIVDTRWHSRSYHDDFRITGTDGVLELSPLNSPALVSPAGAEHIPNNENFHSPAIENFTAAVLDGAPLMCPIADAIQTDWVTAQVRAYVCSGGSV